METNATIVKSQDVDPLNVLGAQVRFLCEAHSTRGAWSLMEVTLPQDAGPPPHTHDWDEAYFITEGEVSFMLENAQVKATQGDFIYAPGGLAHGFKGASQNPARVLIFDAPAHAGAFFKRVDREVKDLPRDLSKVIDIGAATGIHFLAPGRG
ncbi:MAG: hypothetical protein JWR21_2912 [Herminiimonas sp.]|nr:hypothetical protein [Herminiimonas sp.]MDB5853718.1 hypothetical protein [Herminiimonas sp.]